MYLKIDPLQLAPGLKSGLKMHVDNAREVGADRIVNNVSALHKYGRGKPMIVVDFGTATTFNIISKEGEFIGGVIAPGIRGSLDSLVSGTAKLPRVEIEAPKSVIATNTTTNMQAGIVFGFAGLVEYIVKKIKKGSWNISSKRSKKNSKRTTCSPLRRADFRKPSQRKQSASTSSTSCSRSTA